MNPQFDNLNGHNFSEEREPSPTPPPDALQSQDQPLDEPDALYVASEPPVSPESPRERQCNDQTSLEERVQQKLKEALVAVELSKLADGLGTTPTSEAQEPGADELVIRALFKTASPDTRTRILQELLCLSNMEKSQQPSQQSQPLQPSQSLRQSPASSTITVTPEKAAAKAMPIITKRELGPIMARTPLNSASRHLPTVPHVNLHVMHKGPLLPYFSGHPYAPHFRGQHQNWPLPHPKVLIHTQHPISPFGKMAVAQAPQRVPVKQVQPTLVSSKPSDIIGVKHPIAQHPRKTNKLQPEVEYNKNDEISSTAIPPLANDTQESNNLKDLLPLVNTLPSHLEPGNIKLVGDHVEQKPHIKANEDRSSIRNVPQLGLLGQDHILPKSLKSDMQMQPQSQQKQSDHAITNQESPKPSSPVSSSRNLSSILKAVDSMEMEERKQRDGQQQQSVKENNDMNQDIAQPNNPALLDPLSKKTVHSPSSISPTTSVKIPPPTPLNDFLGQHMPKVLQCVYIMPCRGFNSYDVFPGNEGRIFTEPYKYKIKIRTSLLDIPTVLDIRIVKDISSLEVVSDGIIFDQRMCLEDGDSLLFQVKFKANSWKLNCFFRLQIIHQAQVLYTSAPFRTEARKKQNDFRIKRGPQRRRGKWHDGYSTSPKRTKTTNL